MLKTDINRNLHIVNEILEPDRQESNRKIDEHNQQVIAELPEFFRSWIKMIFEALGPADQTPKKQN